MMKISLIVSLVVCLGTFGASPRAGAQAAQTSAGPAKSAPSQAIGGQAYSGTYAFLREGEFVQVTVEDQGHVTGFVSRFADAGSDKGTFIDQFFKTGKLEGNKLSFTTEIVKGIAFEFKGAVERGEGKNPGDEAYFVLQGTLSQDTTDTSKKVTSHTQEVHLKMFPQDAEPAPGK